MARGKGQVLGVGLGHAGAAGRRRLPRGSRSERGGRGRVIAADFFAANAEVAGESVQLVVGNAGGVSVALNGEAMPPIGPAGHVRRVDVSASGMEVVDIEPKPAVESALPDTTSETDS